MAFISTTPGFYPNCKVTHLPLFGQKGDRAEIVKRSDIFFIGGGSTTNMLLLWRAWGLDDLLRAAYEGGKIMAGASAGANCWFEQYIDESLRPHGLLSRPRLARRHFRPAL